MSLHVGVRTPSGQIVCIVSDLADEEGWGYETVDWLRPGDRMIILPDDAAERLARWFRTWPSSRS
jgi:hypothetical protein